MALFHLFVCIFVDSDFFPLLSFQFSASLHHLCPISNQLTFQFWRYCMKSRMINCGCSVFVLFVYMRWNGDITNKSAFRLRKWHSNNCDCSLRVFVISMHTFLWCNFDLWTCCLVSIQAFNTFAHFDWMSHRVQCK